MICVDCFDLVMSGKELEVKMDSQIQVIDLSQAKEAMRAFQKFKEEVLTEDDYYIMPGDPKKKKNVRKSGWMKYAMALSITTQVYNEVCQTIKFKDQEVLVYNFSAKAVAPNGRFAEAVGSASSDEGKPWASAIHSIRAMAQTRAVERSISNLIGGGEVGAEELDTKTVDAEYRVKQTPQPSNQPLSSHMSDEEVTGEKDIVDALEAAKLQVDGVIEIVTRDFGKFEISQVQSLGDQWGKYHEVLKGFGAVYHRVEDPDPSLRKKWTIGV